MCTTARDLGRSASNVARVTVMLPLASRTLANTNGLVPLRNPTRSMGLGVATITQLCKGNTAPDKLRAL